jgi:hypothetical protein
VQVLQSNPEAERRGRTAVWQIIKPQLPRRDFLRLSSSRLMGTKVEAKVWKKDPGREINTLGNWQVFKIDSFLLIKQLP